MAQANTIDMIYFGNPVFDITVTDDDRTVMTKYSLELGMASLVTPEQMPIYDEIWARSDKFTSPGGSALNSARAQMHSNPAGSVAYFGCIGNDDKGRALTEAVTTAGIQGRFEVSETEPTSLCAAVVVGKERTLCAHIAAARKFSMDYLNSNMADLEKAKFLYTTGFFIDSNADAVRTICEYATANDKPLGFNCSALFVVQFFMDKVKSTIKHADYVFCNEDEGSAFATAEGLEATDRVGIAKKIASYEKASNTRPRIVIITQGAEPTIVATGRPGEEATVEMIPVAPIDPSTIVDTNGAGDSFVGGFFAELAKGSDLRTAVDVGNTLAGKVIQRSGAVYE